MNDSEVLIAHISPNGYYDGYVLKHIEEVYRVEYDGEYEKRIEKLYRAKGQAHNFASAEDDGALFYTALSFAKENDLVVSLMLGDDYRAGFVDNYNDDTVFLNALNEDGVAVVRINEILWLEIDTDYEQDLRILHGKLGR